jgi:hypothetical protein
VFYSCSVLVVVMPPTLTTSERMTPCCICTGTASPRFWHRAYQP